MSSKRCFWIAASCLALLQLASAQNEGAIGGTIQDSSGAVLAGAAVKLTSHEQGTVRTAVTNPAGVYEFSFLPAGTYDVEVTASGFKLLKVTDITLAVAENVRRDFKLEVGAVSENVTVSAASETVNTDNATLSEVVDNTKVVEMPLNGRLFYNLASLTPGVMPAAQNSSNSTRGGFNIMGECDVCNNFLLNGFFNNNEAAGIPAVRPSIDAIQEFNILTGVYPAQYGYNSGGQIIVTTKSGTNEFHGAGFEFLRNQDMDARNFFSTPGPLPSFKRNQFGGVLGGPIQKNKMFFFFNYEGLRLDQGINSLTTYPTTAMDTGNFSGISKLILEPGTKTPFPGNMIPLNMISAIGQKLLELYPAPNIAEAPGALPSNNYSFQEPRLENYNQFSLKIDYSFSAKDSAFATANYYHDVATETGATFSAGCTPYYVPEFTCTPLTKHQVYGINETHVFSPTMVNEARVGFSMVAVDNFPTTAFTDFWGQYGIQPLISPAPNGTRVPTYGYPNTSITGFTAFGSGNVAYYHMPTWEFSDALSWTKGKHTIRFGADIIHFNANNINLGSQAGTLSFTNTSSGPTSGYGLADVLLGLPASTGSTPYKYQLYVRSATPAFYVQDDFKVTQRLTINLGLRWETNTPLVDNANNLAGFDPKTGLPVVTVNPAPIPFPNPVPYETLNRRSLWTGDWLDFAPRIGYAWQPFKDGKTVVRGGFGTFYNSQNVLNNISQFPGAPPYTLANTFTSSTTAPLLLTNPFPTSGAVTSNSPVGVDANFKNPRVYEWTTGIERQLRSDMLLDVTYAGSDGNHLQGTQNINQPPPGPGTPAQVNARRPYPQFGSISYTEWDFNSHYDSLQAKLTKRYAYGLSFLASYVYSHSLDDTGTLTNQYNFKTGYGSSSFDVRNRIVISAVWELPFGQGRQWVREGVASKVIGGWQLSPLIQWQTGIPLTSTLSGNYTNSGGSTDRPNLICNPNNGAPHTVQEWFNTSCFQVPLANGVAGATYAFGNEGRSVILGPGLVNVDISIVRDFRIREGMKLQFRGEFFDVLNHPNWGVPNVVADGGPSFGTITSTIAANVESGGSNRTTQVALKFVF
jgi:Carboxypeptidase regulatory-like domain